MKIRQGFVSNSSSASYIVTPTKKFDNIDQLLNDIYEHCWCAINASENDYFDSIELYHLKNPPVKRTTIDNSGPLAALLNISSRPERIRYVTSSDRYNNSSYIDNRMDRLTAMYSIMEAEGITISSNVTDPGIFHLSYFTSMHNSFNDMNNLLKNIYLEYLLNRGGATIAFYGDE